MQKTQTEPPKDLKSKEGEEALQDIKMGVRNS